MLQPNLDVASGDSGVGVAISADGQHWIAAGNLGVVVDGVMLPNLDVACGDSGVGVAMAADGRRWIAAGNLGVSLGDLSQ